jgi:Cd2+/Zn2+-exporting ATPase
MGCLRQASAVLAGACGFFAVLGWAFHSDVLYLAACVFGSVAAVRALLQSLKERKLDVNFLMLLAAAGAIAIGHPEDAAVLLFLFSLSGALEEAALGKARSAIEALVKLRPPTAIRRGPEGDVEIRVEEVRAGDRLLVPSHTGVPVDGVVLAGASTVDQSSMTGESAPVEVGPGSKILGGTLNLEGRLEMEATATAGSSTLDRVMALVQEAQENKAGGERLSQWLGQWYTIGVVAAFVVAFVIRRFVLHQPQGEALYDSLILLVALSPCALVISVPAATLSALAWCGRNGLLVRGGEFIERAGKVTAIAFDKTGTLTRGRPKLVDVRLGSKAVSLESPEAVPALRMAMALEAHNSHPVARALYGAGEALGLTPSHVESLEVVPGSGVRAVGPDGPVWIGHLPEDAPADVRAAAEEMRASGQTVAALQHSGIVLFGVRDEPREEAAAVLQELRSLGVRHLAMLTGDQESTARAIAAPLGLDEVRSGLLPHEKEETVGDLVRRYKTVMMVGDGANDAPSLARAYLGVGMGGLGNEAALAASDVVIMRESLTILPEFLRLGRKAAAVIRANLILAGSMVLALTVASLFGQLPLPLAVLGHEGSTVIVILNGLRLLRGP